jgi:nucleotide-binding universal stress UspA family protein
MYERILIAYDGSKEAERALAEGLTLAAATQARVTIATVAEPLPGYYNMAAMVAPDVPETARRDRLQQLEELQAKATEFSTSHGLTVTTTLLEAGEVQGILSAARALKADLLVIGLRRHVQNIEWAGTVRQVANETPCSILAVV